MSMMRAVMVEDNLFYGWLVFRRNYAFGLCELLIFFNTKYVELNKNWIISVLKIILLENLSF